jgi:hypothetical protein
MRGVRPTTAVVNLAALAGDIVPSAGERYPQRSMVEPSSLR